MTQTHRVAYLVSRFPKLSETFIVDEILELARLGVPIDIYALVEEREAIAHPEARELARNLHAANRSRLASLGAAVAWLWEKPGVFGALFVEAIRSSASSPGYLLRSLAALFAAGHFARRMRRDGVTHIHAHWATHPALMARAIERLTGIPYSFTLHADDLFVQQNLLEEKLRDAGRIVTISDYNARFLREHYPDATAGKLEVIHCGVRTDDFSSESPPFVRQTSADPILSQPVKVVCVARFEAKKGHRVLIEACHELAERGLAIECDLAGDGALRAEIEGQIAELGPGVQVRCLGALPREGVRALLAQADVFVLPSIIAEDGRREGIPVALMEAMAMERPVIATRTSGIPELVEDGVTGRLVEPGDVKSLADAIESLARQPDRAQALGRGARQRVCAEFDVVNNALRLREIVAPPAAPQAAAGAAVAVEAAESGAPAETR